MPKKKMAPCVFVCLVTKLNFTHFKIGEIWFSISVFRGSVVLAYALASQRRAFT